VFMSEGERVRRVGSSCCSWGGGGGGFSVGGGEGREFGE